jgi:hypothetical protein
LQCSASIRSTLRYDGLPEQFTTTLVLVFLSIVGFQTAALCPVMWPTEVLENRTCQSPPGFVANPDAMASKPTTVSPWFSFAGLGKLVGEQNLIE